MKKDTRHYLGWSARLRLLGRIVGITALFAALAGFAILVAVRRVWGHIRNALFEAAGQRVAALMIVLGGVLQPESLFSKLFPTGRLRQRSAQAQLGPSFCSLCCVWFG